MCNKMDGPRKQYAKSYRNRQMSHDFTQMWNMKIKTKQMDKQNKNKLIEAYKDWWLPE